MLLEARTRSFLADQRAADARSRAALAATAAARAATVAASREEWHESMRRVALQQALDAAAKACLAAKNGVKAAKAEALASARVEVLNSLRASAGACSRSQQKLRQRLLDEELALRRSPERMRRAAAELSAERRRILRGGDEASDGSAGSSSPGRAGAEGGREDFEAEEEAVPEIAPSSVGGCFPSLPLLRTEEPAETTRPAVAAAAAPLAAASPLPPAPPAQLRVIFSSGTSRARRKLSCFGRSPATGDEEEEEEEAEAKEVASLPAAAPAAPAPVLTAASTAKTAPAYASASARPTINLTATTAAALDPSSPARNFFMFACASPSRTRGGGAARNGGGTFASAWAATAEA